MGLLKLGILLGGAYAIIRAYSSKSFDRCDKTRQEQQHQQVPYQTMDFVAPQLHSETYSHQPYCNGQCGYQCNTSEQKLGKF
jgi:hypothetical protein